MLWGKTRYWGNYELCLLIVSHVRSLQLAGKMHSTVVQAGKHGMFYTCANACFFFFFFGTAIVHADAPVSVSSAAMYLAKLVYFTVPDSCLSYCTFVMSVTLYLFRVCHTWPSSCLWYFILVIIAFLFYFVHVRHTTVPFSCLSYLTFMSGTLSC